MIKYFIKRIIQDWVKDLGFIVGICCLMLVGFIACICCLILVIFINTKIVDYTGWCTDKDVFLGILMLIPEGFIIHFMGYLFSVYKDYQKINK